MMELFPLFSLTQNSMTKFSVKLLSKALKMQTSLRTRPSNHKIKRKTKMLTRYQYNMMLISAL